jgi:hypothetical protein
LNPAGTRRFLFSPDFRAQLSGVVANARSDSDSLIKLASANRVRVFLRQKLKPLIINDEKYAKNLTAQAGLFC